MTTPSTSSSCQAALDFCERDFDAAVKRLCDVLRIPSISTDPESAPDVMRAAEWYAEAFRELDMEADVVRTDGHPMVFARHPAPEGMPTILYYGHYDVQPADPLELWDSPPFDPKIVDDANGGRIVARGAVDDKGQVATILEALRAWHEGQASDAFRCD